MAPKNACSELAGTPGTKGQVNEPTNCYREPSGSNYNRTNTRGIKNVHPKKDEYGGPNVKNETNHC